MLLVSHGLTMRLFCMRWFHWSVKFFETLRNPDNAETRVLLRNPTTVTGWTGRSSSGPSTNRPNWSDPHGCRAVA